MNTREQIIQELEQVPESVLTQVLDFLRTTKAAQFQEELENQEDIEDARAELEAIKTEGTTSWETLKAELGIG